MNLTRSYSKYRYVYFAPGGGMKHSDGDLVIPESRTPSLREIPIMIVRLLTYLEAPLRKELLILNAG